jgi:hypothetical protein
VRRSQLSSLVLIAAVVAGLALVPAATASVPATRGERPTLAGPACTKAAALAVARRVNLGGRDRLAAVRQAFCGPFAGHGSHILLA